MIRKVDAITPTGLSSLTHTTPGDLFSCLGYSSLLGTKDFGTWMLLRPACREESAGSQGWAWGPGSSSLSGLSLARCACSVDSGRTGLMTLPQRDETPGAPRGSELGRHGLAVSKQLLEGSPSNAQNSCSRARESH